MKVVEKSEKRIVLVIDTNAKKLGCIASIVFMKHPMGGIDILYKGKNPWLPKAGVWIPWKKIRIIIEEVNK